MISRRVLPSVWRRCVFDGSRVVEHAVGGYPPKRVVGLAVTTAVETVPNCLASRGLDGTGAA